MEDKTKTIIKQQVGQNLGQHFRQQVLKTKRSKQRINQSRSWMILEDKVKEKLYDLQLYFGRVSKKGFVSEKLIW